MFVRLINVRYKYYILIRVAAAALGFGGKLRRTSKRTELLGRKKNEKISSKKKKQEFYGAPTLGVNCVAGDTPDKAFRV